MDTHYCTQMAQESVCLGHLAEPQNWALALGDAGLLWGCSSCVPHAQG